jgi:hypothetical protein
VNHDWRNDLATAEQIEKLRFFGCTWDEGVTAGQAHDALEECAGQFPDAEAAWQKNQPATEKQKDKLRFFGCTWNGEITMGKASDALVECAKEFPDKEADWQFQKKKWSKIAGSFPDTALQQADEALSRKVLPKFQIPIPRRATTIKTAIVPGTSPTTFEHSDEEVSIQKAEPATNKPSVRREGFFCGENEAVPHIGKIRPKQEPTQEVTIQEATKP